MQFGKVREAIAAAAKAAALLAGVKGSLTCTGYTPDGITEPHFFVGEFTVTYDRTFGRGTDEAEYTCRVLVGRADDRAAQELLDALLSSAGPSSLKTAIEAARGAPGELALGGLADDLHVVRMQGYRWYEHANTEYVGAELVVRVIGSGSS